MKKVFLTLALAAFAMGANAQFVVSGNFGCTHSADQSVRDGNVVYTTSPQKSTDFNINLTAGYRLNEKLQLGVALGYGNYTTITETSLVANPTNVNTTTTNTFSEFNAGVYARYYAAQFGKFNLFGEAMCRVLTSSGLNKNEVANVTTENVRPKSFGFELSVVPGLNYSINEHLSLDLYLDFMNLGYSHTKYTYADPANPKEYTDDNYDITNACGLVINNGITGNFFLNNFRLGLNYAF